MKTICIDSTVIIDFLKGKTEAAEQLAEIRRSNIPCTTGINVFEVMHGLFRKKDGKAIEIAENFFNSCHVFSINFEAAKKSASITAELSEKGSMINEMDAIIAGAMLTNGCHTIATADVKDFHRIKEITIY